MNVILWETDPILGNSLSPVTQVFEMDTYPHGVNVLGVETERVDFSPGYLER